MARENIVGQRFGKLVVLKDSGKRSSGAIQWECQCDCGNITDTPLRKHLKSGATTSCGCHRKEIMTKHGESTSRLYDIWIHIKDRTGNPDGWGAENYYDRGIKLCEEWKDYPTFSAWSKANGYTEETTIDRIDVDGNYEPSNCRWTTPLQQANNKTTNLYLEFNGKTQSMADWSREVGLSYETVRSRIRRGWDIERALTQPQQIKNKKE